MNDEEKVINSDESGQNPKTENTQPAASGAQSGEKLFTQKEVDEIIRIRLERERKKYTPREPTETELREKKLAERENRVACKEYLSEYGYSPELIDIIDTSNPEEFKQKADKASQLIGSASPAAEEYEPLAAGTACGDSIADAFKNTRHRPRGADVMFDISDGNFSTSSTFSDY